MVAWLASVSFSSPVDFIISVGKVCVADTDLDEAYSTKIEKHRHINVASGQLLFSDLQISPPTKI